jgi:hypothetical protein
MKTKKTKLVFIPFWVFISVFIIAACSTDETDELEVDDILNEEVILEQIKSATEKYHDLDAAVADGYMLDPHCVEHPEFGGMGNHAINMDRIGPFVVPSEPGVLVYEPTGNGEYVLVAAEFLVPSEPWDDMNPNGPPMLGEVAFDDHREIIFMEDENGEQVPVNARGGPPIPHYQLHVWVWKDNPNGMYAPFNPDVSCQSARERERERERD